MSKKPQQPAAAETVRFSGEDVANLTAGLSRQYGSLVVIQGLDVGIHQLCDRPITIGREASIGLTLLDTSISRRHCRVELDEQSDRYVVRDLGSTNRTRLNGKIIEAPTPLNDGDKISLGSTVIKFGYSDKLDVEYLSRLERWVRTDSLTGLLVRRQFDKAFAHEVEQAGAAGADLAVLVMDMDGIKQINDTHGHEFGGFSIVEGAKIIQSCIEHRGQLCRWGGDEFIAFLRESDKEEGCRLAEAIRNGIANHVFVKDDIEVQPTISIGVSAHPEDGSSTDELFRAADRALYRAKAAGRNSVAT